MANEDKMKMVKIGVAVLAIVGVGVWLASYYGVFDSDKSKAPPEQLTLTPEEQKEKDKQEEVLKKLETKRPSAGS